MRRPTLKGILNTARNAAAASAVAFLFAPAALAQGASGPDLGLGFATAIGLATTDIRTVAARIISYALGFLGVVVLGIMLYAGFTWMTAGGNEEKVTSAKKMMTNGVIGLIIVMSSFAITQFIFRAIGEGTGGISTTGCPPGQVCGSGGGSGGGFGGGGDSFRVEATAPAGPGSGSTGWPKNYAITVTFSAAVADASVTPGTVDVRKCNPRLNGSGDPALFNASSCGAPVAGTLAVDGNRVRFSPSATPGPEPTDFEGDFWYKIRLQGGAIRDAAGRTLLCPFQVADVSSVEAGGDYCERAMAFSDIRDVQPPTVSLNAPATPPALCASPTARSAQVVAVANDDFVVAGIDFLLDGGSANLVDADGQPLATAANAGLANPFTGDAVHVDLGALSAGSHVLSAVARDGVPQSSASASRNFTVNPAHCCNAVRDAGDGETDVDCGGACGACDGARCTTNAQCTSGFCDSASGQCRPRPFIQSVTPMTGGVGTIITLSGTGFGTAPGGVVFLGTDTDGNNDPEGDADDVSAAACAAQAWSATQASVAVPAGAVSGPIKLVTAGGPSDRTDDASGPALGSFSVSGPTLPGVCFLSPSEGGPGAKVAINGSGFGAAQGSNQAFIGASAMTVVTCGAGGTDCGWSDTRVWVTVPPIPESAYPVRLAVNGSSTNARNFFLRNSTAGQPRVTAVIPESGPVGSYLTIQGSGFGSLKGVVKLKLGADTAIAAEPACVDSWNDSYIIVKVPTEYEGGLPVSVSAAGVAHKVQVVTAPPARSSNDDLTFRVTNEAPRPGVCAIVPDNGPAGSPVVIYGEGFGSGPGSATGSPRFSVEFFKSNARHCLFSAATACPTLGALCANPAHGVCVQNAASASGYASWSGAQIGTVVAGDAVSGPVRVVANNQLSGNAVPFTVQNCATSGVSCASGTTCCANGSCQASCVPIARDSAYGWRFSTDVLPTLPVVVERASCSATSNPPVHQSPSPASGTTDACRNAQLFFEFNREMDATSFTSASVRLEECGDGAMPNCTATVPLQPFTAPGTFGVCDSIDSSRCKTFQARPADSYDGGSHLFKKKFWYRVTLVSDPAAGTGLREAGDEVRYLDGDKDRRQGGEYVTTFRVRDGDNTCQLSSVTVVPSVATIAQDQDPIAFTAGFQAGNCNLLQCGGDQPYAIGWSAPGSTLALQPASANGCVQPVLAVSETPPGVPTPLSVTVLPAPYGSAPSSSGMSQVTVKFADPRIVDATPKTGCAEACVNAAITATFNVPMNPASLTGSTVELKRCRNASCTAPFASTLGGTVTGISVLAAPTDGAAPGGGLLHKHLTVQISGALEPGTFYLARVRGGATGAKSRSGVPLTGLNDGQYYSWKFRTRDDASLCEVSRTVVTPNRFDARFVGERKDFRVAAFGTPDQCGSGGQELNAGAFNWLWTVDAPNPVVQGFIDGIAPFMPLDALASPAQVVDAASVPRRGCTAGCLFAGSQNALPQCGNGIVEARYEECDDGNANDADGCTNQCLLRGNVAPACGNGTLDSAAGEACEAVADAAAPGGFAWPVGCKQPGVRVEGFADNIGCVFTGASAAARSVCGDSLVGDGEACDDGNTANGDGCSASCLKEGTLRTCLGAAAGQPCVNFCGNGVDEPGEDPECDPNPGQNGCSPQTCLKLGTPTCAGGATARCCGNGVADAGEDAACDGPSADPDRAQFCTDRCLLRGSSALYSQPSFCGDGVVGKGERAACEPSDFVEPPPTPKVDPYQALAVAPQSGFNPGPGAQNVSRVKATVAGVSDANSGRAEVRLACNCKNEPVGTQDAFCQNLNSALACADNGCCTPRPTVEVVEPTLFNSCRNALVTLTFSELMDAASITQNLLVGYNNGNAPCPAGSVEVRPLALGEQPAPSFWRRMWDGVAGFFRSYVLRPVFGNPPAPPSPTEQAERYCSVEGTISTVAMGPPASQKSVTTFSPRRALPANKYIRVRLNPDAAKSAKGVPLSGYVSHFGTSGSICAITKVSVTPASVLLASVQDRQTVVARGESASGQAIVPTADYTWEWSWGLATAIPAALAWEIVIEPRQTNVTQCALGSTCTTAAGCSCSIGGATCTVPNGQSTCAVNVTLPTAVADVRVRGSKTTDLPQGFPPQSSRAPRPVEAIAHVVSAGGFVMNISSVATTGSGKATVMLCKNPWPQYQSCVNNVLTLPWDKTASKTCLASTWYPFYDPETNVEFSYCRDTEAAAAPLPCLREEPARVLRPGPGILKEYLFTFETNPALCPGMSSPGRWADDAIGFRVAENLSHASVSDWYASRGFRGAPTPTTVDGYQAVKDGRTVYANAATKLADGRIFTNVNVLSYSDGAEPETASIFNGILSTINFNRNPDLLDMGICRVGAFRTSMQVRCNRDADCRVDAAGQPVPGRDAYSCDVAAGRCKNGTADAPDAGVSIGCRADLDCQVDADGKSVPARAGIFACDAPKSKLVRDVRRWADLQAIRSQLLQKRDATGRFPTLDAGSFLRAQTNSAWPSWSSALAAPLAVTLPTDPLNRHGACGEPGYDAATCWNNAAARYVCPVDSHVYEYRSIGGADFQIRNDFEYVAVNGGADTWAGNTCIERSASACNPTNDPNSACMLTCSAGSANAGASCVTNADCSGGTCTGACNYKDGKILIAGGAAPFAGAWCQGTPVGVGGSCGDGILSPTEQCEIGQTQSMACDANPAAAVRAGSRPMVCSRSCQWIPAGTCSFNAANAGATCAVDADCRGGADVKCVNWAGAGAGQQDFRCVGGTTPGAACAGLTCPGDGRCVGACVGGTCGDGVLQNPPETCDDGSQNGTYGRCNATCTGFANSCGDGQKQPNEACDCREKNGQYAFNGILSRASSSASCLSDTAGSTPLSAPTCSWDCQSAAPRCGDLVVNGGETCDGGFQQFKGYCNDAAKTGCDTNAQCPNGGICGNFCPTPEQRQRRSCRPNDPASSADDSGSAQACTWGTWTCTAPGSCGNGAKETGEECDDGNTVNTDACVIDPSRPYFCKAAKCGDGYVNPAAGEECDAGTDNGRTCVPEYGLTCNYCSGSCRVSTVSGGYCGDNLLQDSTWTPPGPEQCDGTTGLGDAWVCVSQKPELQSFGKITGYSGCKTAECSRACADPGSVACQNVGSNTDNDSCAGFIDPVSGFCLSAGAAPTPGSSAGLTTFSGPGGPVALRDSCDPDLDNDGVPNQFDCAPSDRTVYPAYTIPAPGGPIVIAAPAEICDGKDNDCNGATDNAVVVSGRIIDAQSDTGAGLSGASFKILCGSQEVGSGTSNASGDYTLAAVNDGTCGDRFTIVGANNSLACADPADAVTVNIAGRSCANPITRCGTGTCVPDLISTRNPSATGDQFRVVMQWGNTPGDLDFHAKDSAGNYTYYGSKNEPITDPTRMSLDRDDTNGIGPETMTLRTPANDRKYAFYVDNYSGRNLTDKDWGSGPVKMRLYDNQCGIRTWTAPVTGTNPNRYWNVFTMQNGNIIAEPNALQSAAPANP